MKFMPISANSYDISHLTIKGEPQVFINMNDNNPRYGSKITIRIEKQKYQDLRSLCKAHKITVTDVLRGLLEKLLIK
jgi:hypothetical protein